MFDVLLREMATRFGLGEKAHDVLAALLGLIFDPASGGFDGFLRRLRAGGLGAQLDSWLSRGENQPVNSAAIERALGEPLVTAFAGLAGFTTSRMASTLTALLPSTLDKLSPDGVRPSAGQVPAAVQPLLASQSPFVAQARALWPNAVDSEASVPVSVPKPAVAHAPAAAHSHDSAHLEPHADEHAHGPVSNGGMGGSWIVWVTLAAILAAAYGWFSSISAPPTAAPATLGVEPQVAAVRSAAQAPAQASLRLEIAAAKVQLAGVVDGPTTAQALESAARTQFGERLELDLKTEARVGPAPWLQVLLAALPQLDRPGLRLQLDGLNAELVNLPTGSDESIALAELSPLFSRLRRGGLFDPAIRAFATLPPEEVAAPQLIAALNLMRVHFESGSRTIRDDSQRVLASAAQVIARAPEATVIEIGGHTDSRGDAQSNRDLSEQRAFAVQEALIGNGVHYSRLTARGYGSSTPLAENSTREGRAQNRRIEFRLLR